jgi:hypothetical protein
MRFGDHTHCFWANLITDPTRKCPARIPRQEDVRNFVMSWECAEMARMVASEALGAAIS